MSMFDLETPRRSVWQGCNQNREAFWAAAVLCRFWASRPAESGSKLTALQTLRDSRAPDPCPCAGNHFGHCRAKKRRKSLFSAFLCVPLRLCAQLACFLLAFALPTPADAAERPNILWLVSEDNDTFLGCYDDALARTPTLDRLAGQGVLFERCFAQPVCAPSRFALITGMYSVTCGPAEHMRAQGKIPAWLEGFPSFLRRAGYYTSNNAKTDYNSAISLKNAWDACGPRAHWRNRPDPKQPFSASSTTKSPTKAASFPPGKRTSISLPPTPPLYAFRLTSPTRRKSAPIGSVTTTT